MNRIEKVKRECFEHTKKELPDCVMSYIFSKLSMKDLVKTSILSKTWIHEWRSTKDLNFDIHNMFGCSNRYYPDGNSYYFDLEKEDSPHFRVVIKPEFVERVNKFMLNYEGANIHSLKVNFPLGDDYGYVIDRLISQGISKGAQRIELLLSYKSSDNYSIEPYTFSLSENDCLKYLHLQNCLLSPPMDFSRLRKLTTLVLHLVVIEKHMLLGLFSNGVNLADLTLNNCKFDSDLNITCPTLCHLNIVDHKRHLRWAPPPRNEEIPHAFDIIASLHQLQNLSINLTHSQITILPKSLGPFQYLRKLELFISDEMPNHDFFRILDIVMASPRLQELFVTIKDLHLVSDHEHMKEPERFSHNELKYVEFRGCECKAFQNLLDKHLWGNMKSSPKKIAFKSCGKFYVGAGIWIKGYSKDHWLGSGVNYMCDILRDSLINKLYLSFCSIN
ncbi:F-box/FBD/LRR-repeat protein At1g13570 isoform X1 [Medicago truncatula]|uniref:F-box/FBD/LRR-repeat protein At1g13570 isoform X1 n=1 Tax=Medicago truncatula TaxID=3880 RepID=UPI0019683590|nr:F-box/FBD/LRR-repeat protein At1g13570-like isoform X1 [Medicago truncatula]XP_039686580.1 F-box/FBD/LRR-repeat protein At1g13570-like isoform X1 [Medicago truncatula]XP_039686581.1 F-box/FBD/LRR-repeat protein At1g13570-like isoform X1 [Medicago truncatula]